MVSFLIRFWREGRFGRVSVHDAFLIFQAEALHKRRMGLGCFDAATDGFVVHRTCRILIKYRHGVVDTSQSPALYCPGQPHC